jgi:hypothetical protein
VKYPRLVIWSVRNQYGLLKDETTTNIGYPYYAWLTRKDAMRFLAECDAMGAPVKNGRATKLRVTIEELE